MTAAAGGAAGTEPRDVIVVMTDQHRADLCAREGFGVDCTPTLDRLARGGRWFDRAYTAAPVCVPARVSMLTGRYPSAHGIRENHPSPAPRYTRDLFDLARDAGMRTALIGKNHSHLTPDRVDEFCDYGHFGRLPPDAETGEPRRFDDWLRALGARTATAATPFDVAAQLPARIVDRAVSWLDAGRADRSLLWLSIPEPHVPYQVPEPYFSRYSPATVPPAATGPDQTPEDSPPWRYVRRLAERTDESDPAVLARARASYVGMLRLIDDQIARLVGHLAGTGRLKQTLIVFLSDHGDFAGEYGLMRKGPQLPEVLVRIPMLFHGPRIVPRAAPSEAHVSIVDVLPTVCELLGWPIPDGVQGRSLVPVLRGEPYPEREFGSLCAEQGFGGLPYPEPPATAQRDDALSGATQSGTMRMVRSGRWKLRVDDLGRFALYDLHTDPYELADRYRDPQCAQARGRMLELLTAWLVRSADPLPIPAGGHARHRHARNHHWTDPIDESNGPRRRGTDGSTDHRWAAGPERDR